jgi:hypothetical protein
MKKLSGWWMEDAGEDVMRVILHKPVFDRLIKGVLASFVPFLMQNARY